MSYEHDEELSRLRAEVETLRAALTQSDRECAALHERMAILKQLANDLSDAIPDRPSFYRSGLARRLDAALAE